MSMDVDPVTEDEAVAEIAYECLIGSEFERTHGFHVNLMPRSALSELPDGWEARAARARYGRLEAVVPAPADLLAPKDRRDEPRDRRHRAWAERIGLLR